MVPASKSRIDDQLAVAQTPREAALILARHAEDLARMGHEAQAREAVDRARRALAGRTDAAANCAILVAEGHIQALADVAAARTTFARAAAIARSAGVAEACAYAHAWIAQVDQERYDLTASLQALGVALAHLQAEHTRAKSRIAVVVAFWHFHAGDAPRALQWCDAARRLAAADGDTAMHSAVMAHVAAIRVGQLRLREVMLAPPPSPAQAEMTVHSSLNFDRVLDAETLGWCGPLLLADAKVHAGHHEEALALYRAHLEQEAGNKSVGHVEAPVRVEMAWCLTQLGRPEEALQGLREAEAVMHLLPHLDERVVTQGRMAALYDRLGQPTQGEQHRQQQARDRQALQALRERLRTELGALLAQHGIEQPWPLSAAAREPAAGYAA